MKPGPMFLIILVNCVILFPGLAHPDETATPVAHGPDSQQTSSLNPEIHSPKALDHTTLPILPVTEAVRPRLKSSKERPAVESPPISPYSLDRFSHGDKIVGSKVVGGGSARVKGGHYCTRPATCEPLEQTACLGAKLPYEHTSSGLVEDALSQAEARERIHEWEQSLRWVPRCWAVVQPLLCALYFPRCDNSSVHLPSQEMCRLVMGPCRIVRMHFGEWPDFLQCANTTKFPPMCKNDLREVRFNGSGRGCPHPLVSTEDKNSWVEGVEGCGVGCDPPLFPSDEQAQIRNLLGWAGSICAAFNLFTVLTFLIDWRAANRYPALVIFYINLCFLVSTGGWLAQFVGSGARKDIVCRKDGTLRMSEPSAGENLSCVIVFVLVYYFLMAGIVWFAILSYAWHISFRALGKVRERVDQRGAYFHLAAWSLPLVLTIAAMALGEVDADGLTGICFVGRTSPFPRPPSPPSSTTQSSYSTFGSSLAYAQVAQDRGGTPTSRAVFLLAPVVIAVAVGGFFLTKGLVTLVRLRLTSKDLISERAGARIREAIVRLALFSAFALLFAILTLVCHAYQMQNRDKWALSLHRYVVCKVMKEGGSAGESALGLGGDMASGGVAKALSELLLEWNRIDGIPGGAGACRFESRPSLAMVQLHILAPFAAGVVMSSWVWTSSTMQAWRRFFRRVCNSRPVDEPVRLQKHKVIARAFAKRKEFDQGGRLSISFHTTHEDPVGLEFDLNSVGAASGDLSSAWAAALPHLVMRRGAIAGATGLGMGGPNSFSSQVRRNSMDSEISYSVRRLSVESRRHSLDSQVSVQISEVKARATTATPLPLGLMGGNSRSVGGWLRAGSRAPPQRKRRRKVVPAATTHRRGSSTSQESQLGAEILSALGVVHPQYSRNLDAIEIKENSFPKPLSDTAKLAAMANFPFTLPGQTTSEMSADEDDVKNALDCVLSPSHSNKDNQGKTGEESKRDSGLLGSTKTPKKPSSASGDHQSSAQEASEGEGERPRVVVNGPTCRYLRGRRSAIVESTADDILKSGGIGHSSRGHLSKNSDDNSLLNRSSGKSSKKNSRLSCELNPKRDESHLLEKLLSSSSMEDVEASLKSHLDSSHSSRCKEVSTQTSMELLLGAFLSPSVLLKQLSAQRQSLETDDYTRSPPLKPMHNVRRQSKLALSDPATSDCMSSSREELEELVGRDQRRAPVIIPKSEKFCLSKDKRSKSADAGEDSVDYRDKLDFRKISLQ
ncbi:protein smoothened isoform X2 [Ischnura elegans]|nr:protein smoothened isoform X2 [Ischnura elegans]